MPSYTKKQAQLRIHEIVERIRSRATASADDSESAKKERREHARADRLWGLSYYFPHYFDAPFAAVHEEILKSSRIKGTPTVIAAPRGSGKSTVAQCHETLRIALGELHFLVIGSQTEDLAAGHTIPIKLEIEENPRLAQDFGDLRGNYKWEEADFITSNHCRILARGIGQKIRGLRYRQYRPEYFRLDDTEDDVSAANPKRVKKLLDWISKSVIPAGKEAGLEATILYIGTVIQKRCAIDHLLHNPDYSAWRRIKIAAITGVAQGLSPAAPGGVSYWPEKFPAASLEKIKAVIGTKAWQSEMQQEPRDEEGDFQEQWIRYYHPAELIGVPLIKVMAIDPSIKEETTACYKAIITLGMDPEGIIYVLDAFIRHCSITQMIESSYLRCAEFDARCVGLETVAGQAFLELEFNRTAAEKGRHLPLRRIEQKENKEVRIKSLGPLVERGVVRFQKGHSDQNLLIEQFLDFPSGAVDGPDALEMAVRLLKNATQKFEYLTVERRQCAGLRKAGAF